MLRTFSEGQEKARERAIVTLRGGLSKEAALSRFVSVPHLLSPPTYFSGLSANAFKVGRYGVSIGLLRRKEFPFCFSS